MAGKIKWIKLIGKTKLHSKKHFVFVLKTSLLKFL